MSYERKRQTTAAWQQANRSRQNVWHKDYRKRKPEYSILAACRKNARRRGHECDLTLKDVRELLAPMRCSVTGHELSMEWDGRGKNPWAPSLDRIDNAVGYVRGNVRLVCWAFNLAKGEWDDRVFHELAASYLRIVP